MEVATKRFSIGRLKYRGSFSVISPIEVCHFNFFGGCGYFWGSWVSFVTTDEFSVRVTKISSRVWIMVILSKGCKTNHFEWHSPLKLRFTNIRALRSNFIECESFLESNSPNIMALCETNLDVSIDSVNFSVTAYLPLITHLHGLAVYVKEGIPFARDLPLENSANSYLFFLLLLFHLLLFPL